MRAVVQRVTRASVKVEGELVGAIERGFLVLIGVSTEDTSADASYIADKLCGLRVFEDAEDKMNLGLQDVGGSLLLVSQFTLYGDCRKGKRPSFIAAARPEQAEALYEEVVALCRARGITTETGRFQTDMAVELVNDGPVTLLLESKKAF